MFGKTNYLRALAAGFAMGHIPINSNIVAYVRSAGQRSTDSDTVKAKFYTTLAAALALTTANAGDVVVVLPGHDEVVGTTQLANLKAGTYVVGVGNPDAADAPRFTWAGASSNWALNKADCFFANLRLYADADNVTKAVTVTAAGASFINCRFDTGNAAAKDMAILFSLEAGANQFSMVDCRSIGLAGVSQVLNQSAAISELLVTGNHLVGVTSGAAVGVIAIAGTSAALCTDMLITKNVIEQRTGSGTAALTFTDIAHTGYCCDNRFATVVDGTPPAGCGITLAGTSAILVHFSENYGSDGKLGSSGILVPAVTS